MESLKNYSKWSKTWNEKHMKSNTMLSGKYLKQTELCRRENIQSRGQDRRMFKENVKSQKKPRIEHVGNIGHYKMTKPANTGIQGVKIQG